MFSPIAMSSLVAPPPMHGSWVVVVPSSDPYHQFIGCVNHTPLPLCPQFYRDQYSCPTNHVDSQCTRQVVDIMYVVRAQRSKNFFPCFPSTCPTCVHCGVPDNIIIHFC